MLSLEYYENKGLYEFLGCYSTPAQAEEKLRTQKDVRRRNRNQYINPFLKANDLLEVRHATSLFFDLDTQRDLHQVIKRTVLRKNAEQQVEMIIRPDRVAALLAGVVLHLNVLDTKTRKKLTSHDHSDIVIHNDKNLEDETNNVDSVLNLRRKLRYLTHGRKIQLVVIDSDEYRRRIPTYMATLLPEFRKLGLLHTIIMDGSQTVQNDYFFQVWFRSRVRVSNEYDIDRLHREFDAGIIYIESDLDGMDELSMAKLKAYAHKTDKFVPNILGSMLHFERAKIYLNMPLEVSRVLQGTTFHSIFSILLTLGRRVLTPGSQLWKMDTVLSVTSHPQMLPNPQARVIVRKISRQVSEIMESDKGRVNIIMIANKGYGKSTASKILCAALSRKFGIATRSVSSDRYGMFLYKIWQIYGVDPFTLADEDKVKLLTNVSFDDDGIPGYDSDTPSYISQMALKVAEINGITTLEKMLSKRGYERVNLVNQMKEMIVQYLKSDDTLSFTKYYERIQSTYPEDKMIVIYEAHMTTEATQMARSDITFNMEPLCVWLYSALSRGGTDTELIAEQLLSYTYAELISAVNPLVSIGDILLESQFLQYVQA